MPKIIDHDQRREDILDATWELLVRGGIEAATMREIAAQAGFANGALKHYFPGKDDIIKGAYERSLHRLGDHVAAATEGMRGLAALEVALRATLPTAAADQTASRILLSFWERAAFSPELRDGYGDHLASWRAGLVQYLEEAREDGDVDSPVSNEQLVDEAVTLNIGATLLQALGTDYVNGDYLASHVDAFLDRIRVAR